MSQVHQRNEQDSTPEIRQALQKAGYGLFLTTREVCEALRISRSQVYRLRQDGSLRPSRLNREYRYMREDVARYVATGMK